MMFVVLLFVCAEVVASVKFDIIAESPDHTILIKHNLRGGDDAKEDDAKVEIIRDSLDQIILVKYNPRGDDAVFLYTKHNNNTYTLYGQNVDWSVKPKAPDIEQAVKINCRDFEADEYYHGSIFRKNHIDLYCFKDSCSWFDLIFRKEKCRVHLASWHNPTYRPIQVTTIPRFPSSATRYPGGEQPQKNRRPEQKRKRPVKKGSNSTTTKLRTTTPSFYAGKPTKEQTVPDNPLYPSSSSISWPLNQGELPATTESNKLNFPSINHVTPPESENNENYSSILEKNFTLKMLQAFKETYPDKNLVFSPLSIKTVIKVLEEGAEGETKNKISKVLWGVSNPSKSQHIVEGGVFIRIATAMFYQYSRKIKEQFSRSLTDLNVQIMDIDFPRGNLSNFINDGWVTYYTGGRITKIIDPSSIDPLTQLLLLNAVYFEGKWQHGFDPERSHIANFTRSDGTTIKSVLMQSTKRYRAGCYDTYKLCMVQIPYSNSPYVMQVLLPDENITLSEMEDLLTAEELQRMEDNLENKDVDLFLPKFRYELKANLKDVLSKLGLEDIFAEGDFSGIFQGGPLFETIDDLRHAANIDVTEEGSIASAVTALQAVSLKYEPILNIRVNRPFLFFIYNRETKQYLFVGRII